METTGSNLIFLDALVIFFYLGATLALGAYFSRYVKSSGDFLLAGKSLPFWAIGMSIVVSDIGAIDMVSGAGAAYRFGLAQANFDWLGSMPALVFVAFVFVPFYWRSGVYTLPEFLGRRYGRGVRGFQTIIWTGFMLSMLAVMLWTSAVFLGTVLGWPRQTAIWLTVAVVGVYTFAGGLTAVVMTDVIQMVIMFVGAGALLGLSLWKVGSVSALVHTISSRGPEYANYFRLLLPNDAPTPYPWSGILFGLGVVLSTAYFSSNQAVIQRVFGARSEWDAKASVLLAALFKLFIPMLIMGPGLAAAALYPHLKDPDSAVPTLVRDLLPPGLTGLVFAAFFAALMSSVDSYLNSSTTMLITDAYRPAYGALAGRPPSDRHCLFLGRGLTLGLIVLAGAAAPFVDRFTTIYVAIQTLFSLFQGPTLAVLLLGVLWPRANHAGGFAGLLVGVLCAGLLNLTGKKLFPSEEPFLFVAFWSFLVSLGTVAAVSWLTPPPPESSLRGLVWRFVARDAEAQALLREQLEK